MNFTDNKQFGPEYTLQVLKEEQIIESSKISSFFVRDRSFLLPRL